MLVGTRRAIGGETWGDFAGAGAGGKDQGRGIQVGKPHRFTEEEPVEVILEAVPLFIQPGFYFLAYLFPLQASSGQGPPYGASRNVVQGAGVITLGVSLG